MVGQVTVHQIKTKHNNIYKNKNTTMFMVNKKDARIYFMFFGFKYWAELNVMLVFSGTAIPRFTKPPRVHPPPLLCRCRSKAWPTPWLCEAAKTSTKESIVHMLLFSRHINTTWENDSPFKYLRWYIGLYLYDLQFVCYLAV